MYFSALAHLTLEDLLDKVVTQEYEGISEVMDKFMFDYLVAQQPYYLSHKLYHSIAELLESPNRNDILHSRLKASKERSREII
jgi:hypothetical protein